MERIILYAPWGPLLYHYHKDNSVLVVKKWKKYKNGTIGACCLKCKIRWFLVENG